MNQQWRKPNKLVISEFPLVELDTERISFGKFKLIKTMLFENINMIFPVKTDIIFWFKPISFFG